MIKVDPNDPNVIKNKGRIKELLKRDDLTIFIAGTPAFINMLILDTHPIAKQIPKKFKEVLIRGDGLKIQKRLIIKWLDRTLDERNAFVLRNCDIRVVEEPKIKIKE
jgi:hypothetical protein